MINNVEFGKRLEECQKSRKITNKEIEKTLGINKNAISNYKNGQIPKTEILYALSNYFGISIDWLLTGKESADLTEEENKLVEYYRSADERGKRRILQTAELEAQELQSSTSKIG